MGLETLVAKAADALSSLGYKAKVGLATGLAALGMSGCTVMYLGESEYDDVYYTPSKRLVAEETRMDTIVNDTAMFITETTEKTFYLDPNDPDLVLRRDLEPDVIIIEDGPDFIMHDWRYDMPWAYRDSDGDGILNQWDYEPYWPNYTFNNWRYTDPYFSFHLRFNDPFFYDPWYYDDWYYGGWYGYSPYWYGGWGPYGDRDHDGIPNRYDHFDNRNWWWGNNYYYYYPSNNHYYGQLPSRSTNRPGDGGTRPTRVRDPKQDLEGRTGGSTYVDPKYDRATRTREASTSGTAVRTMERPAVRTTRPATETGVTRNRDAVTPQRTETQRQYTPTYTKPRTTTQPTYNRSSTQQRSTVQQRTYTRPSTSTRSSPSYTRPSTPSRSSYSQPSRSYSRPSTATRSSSGYSSGASQSRSSSSTVRSSSSQSRSSSSSQSRSSSGSSRSPTRR